MRDIHAYDYNGGYYDTEIVSDLLNLKCFTDVTEEKQVVSVEIDTEKYHKYGNNPLQINIVAAKAVVFDTKASCSGCAERGTDGIVKRHFPEKQENNLHSRKTKVYYV